MLFPEILATRTFDANRRRRDAQFPFYRKYFEFGDPANWKLEAFKDVSLTDVASGGTQAGYFMVFF